jgi:hypothetical protein
MAQASPHGQPAVSQTMSGSMPQPAASTYASSGAPAMSNGVPAGIPIPTTAQIQSIVNAGHMTQAQAQAFYQAQAAGHTTLTPELYPIINQVRASMAQSRNLQAQRQQQQQQQAHPASPASQTQYSQVYPPPPQQQVQQQQQQPSGSMSYPAAPQAQSAMGAGAPNFQQQQQQQMMYAAAMRAREQSASASASGSPYGSQPTPVMNHQNVAASGGPSTTALHQQIAAALPPAPVPAPAPTASTSTAAPVPSPSKPIVGPPSPPPLSEHMPEFPDGLPTHPDLTRVTPILNGTPPPTENDVSEADAAKVKDWLDHDMAYERVLDEERRRAKRRLVEMAEELVRAEDWWGTLAGEQERMRAVFQPRFPVERIRDRAKGKKGKARAHYQLSVPFSSLSTMSALD